MFLFNKMNEVCEFSLGRSKVWN